MPNARPDRFVATRLAAALLALCLSVWAATAHAQSVSVALTPAAQLVDPGSVFEISITIPDSGLAFNGFDAVIGYDPAALTFLPLSPTSLQQGELMTGACATTFHLFEAGAGTDTITDVLLCNGVSVTGPGRIYRLRFKASNTPQVTEIHFLPGLQFYNDGLYVTPVTSADAQIGIGMGLVDVGATPGRRLELRIAPNPSPGGGTSFTIESDRAGVQRLAAFDLRGRLVRHFDDTTTTAGVRLVHWDGRDDNGHLLPPGVYLVSLHLEDRSVARRVSILR
jgi:flagellar hook capping protein FlgD